MTTETTPSTIQRTTFLEAVERVLPAIGDSNIEGADSVVFSRGWAHAYRDDRSISAPIKELEDTEAAVNAKKLAAIVKKLKADVIEVSRTDTALVLKCGTFTGELLLQPDTLSHAIASLNLDAIQWSPVPDGLGTAIALCRLENHRETFPVVYFSDDLVIAVTSFRWNYGKVSGDPMPTFAIHTDTAKALLSLGELAHYSIGDLWAHFHTESGAIFSAKVQDSAFPIRKVMERYDTIQTRDPMFQVDMPKDLAETVDRVAVFADPGLGDKATPQLDVEISGKYIKLGSKNSTGSAKDKCALNEELPEGMEARFMASVPYLQEAAKKVHTLAVVVMEGVVSWDDGGQKRTEKADLPFLVFRGDQFMQVVSVKAPRVKAPPVQ